MDYRQKGFVSVWVGEFPNETALLRFVAQDFRSSPPRSEFSTAFQLGRFDEDFREASWKAQLPHDMGTSFVNFSWAASYIEELKKKLEAIGYDGYNSIVMLYRFNYSNPTVTHMEKDGIRVTFVGSFAYTE
jgi:hypothetical protein